MRRKYGTKKANIYGRFPKSEQAQFLRIRFASCMQVGMHLSTCTHTHLSFLCKEITSYFCSFLVICLLTSMLSACYFYLYIVYDYFTNEMHAHFFFQRNVYRFVLVVQQQKIVPLNADKRNMKY